MKNVKQMGYLINVVDERSLGKILAKISGPEKYLENNLLFPWIVYVKLSMWT